MHLATLAHLRTNFRVILDLCFYVGNRRFFNFFTIRISIIFISVKNGDMSGV